MAFNAASWPILAALGSLSFVIYGVVVARRRRQIRRFSDDEFVSLIPGAEKLKRVDVLKARIRVAKMLSLPEDRVDPTRSFLEVVKSQWWFGTETLAFDEIEEAYAEAVKNKEGAFDPSMTIGEFVVTLCDAQK